MLLHESVVLYYQNKFKKKNMVDQACFDLIASVEQHRLNNDEIHLFYLFFTLEYSLKELLFFLYVRGCAEKELAILIHKIPSSQDIRSL
jgi:hypothetical protein